MAISNRDRIDKGLEQIRIGLVPFVERELQQHLGPQWEATIEAGFRRMERTPAGGIAWDTYALFKVMWDQWNTVFRNSLGLGDRNYVSELIGVRNDHAHEKPSSSEDTERYLDTMRRLLQAVGAPQQAQVVLDIRKELIRVQQAEETRRETRRAQAIHGTPVPGLRPWREVITPHDDVAKGRYMEAEFAADLDLVHSGGAPAEYADPKEFFARTFLTEGLKELLKIGARRLTGKGGDPVVELQTNFGGGKTHSMLALYHLFSGVSPSELPGLEELLRAEEISSLPKARRAVLVGVNLSVAEVRKKPDGCQVRTMWGEMAWQLGGAEGLAMLELSDRAGTSPGKELLAEVLARFSPCIVLIDEWVALLRQLPDEDGLAAGSYGANISFAQALTEAAKGVPEAFVVASLPQSSIEVGGVRGERALSELGNVIKRLAKPWQPASNNEGFEIVRRRLFQTGMDFSARDAVVKTFSEMYRDQSGEFPSECKELEYRKKLEASYPIHPELFQQFEQAWATLDRFQRTRGILRLMAAVIYELWQRDDRSLLILPSSVTLDSPRVESLIVECLPDKDQWRPILSRDVDGPQSLPQQMDKDNPNLGRYSAARRVTRTIFMGSAPTIATNSPGIDEKRLRLGCAQPGESVATFGDALRRLTDQAVHLYVDQGRYWYSLRATVARLARERADQLKGSPEARAEIVRMLRLEREKGDFAGIHVCADRDDQVDESFDTRLVLLGPDWVHTRRNLESSAVKAAEQILTMRGNSPRIHRNTLVFLAADANRLSELDDAVRHFMAWKSIRDEADNDALDLSNFAKGQARTKTDEYERACKTRLMESWSWILVPTQPEPTKAGIVWDDHAAGGGDALAPKVSQKLVGQENLLPTLGPSRLKMELDRHLWKDTPHVGLKHVADCFSTYLYLPRLTRREVLLKAVQNAFAGTLLCEYFGYATSFEAEHGRYAGLQTNRLTTSVQADGLSVLVKPAVATAQVEADQAKEREGAKIREEISKTPEGPEGGGVGAVVNPPPSEPPSERPKTLYFGSKNLNPSRAAIEFRDIQEEIIKHFSAKYGVEVTVTLEINAKYPAGFDAGLIRTVNENANVLKLDESGFAG